MFKQLSNARQIFVLVTHNLGNIKVFISALNYFSNKRRISPTQFYCTLPFVVDVKHDKTVKGKVVPVH